MKKIPIVQGGPEWLLWRQSHITATSASIIMDKNPFKTRQILWREMLGLKEPDPTTPKMLEGNLLEPEARALANELFNMQFVPCVCESVKYPMFGASLDGITDDGKTLLEIKSGVKVHKQALEGIIPEYYYLQVQWQFLITGAELCYYFTYRPEHKEKYTSTRLFPDLDCQKDLIQNGLEFYRQYSTFEEPVPWAIKLK